jgi:S-adenosylmethionine hydrolase
MTLVTLTSDLGDQDYVLGAVRGTLYKHLPSFMQVDITHRLKPFNDAQAASVIKNTLKFFPEGTYHLILSNFFHYVPENLILAKFKNHYLGLADNGLLGMITDGQFEEITAIPLKNLESKTIPECIELMAIAISKISAGELLSDVGNSSHNIRQRTPLRLQVYDDAIEGQILYVDQFENVVVNISKEEFEFYRKGRGFKIIFRRDEMIDKISSSYADVPEGEKLALFNTSGFLEIAINKGNAAGLLGLHTYDEKNSSLYAQSRHFYHSVKIYFD